jgi:hypothetical protein
MVQKLSPLTEKQRLSLGGESEDIELKPKGRCDHYFEMRSGREIICRKCNVGYYITYGDKVKDGHLFKNDKLIL